MTRDKRYDILFEPVPIGPVTAKNRFYQVPHCTGLGWLRPRMVAALRGMKAEGGWGVVCTEYCSIHPASDDLPHPYASLWDEGDIKAHALMTEKVHEHGSLAGVELWVSGSRSANLFTNEVAMDVSSRPNAVGIPYQTRAMDKADIRELRRWHRNAALRAMEAGFDIVYVYVTHGYLLSHFLSPDTNTRIDEYGGSLENRVRLIREIIEDTKEAVGHRCAVAVRFSADLPGSMPGTPLIGERRDMLEMLAEIPDLWDINISDYSQEMGVSRFVKEGSLEAHMNYVKTITSKPVVTVGRFTSPDTMVSQVKRGIVDFIGAARPSIADPYLPKKIEEGRFEDIRECIGCNICYTGDAKGTPIRCTQNPTISEEWRRGWHPESMAPKGSDSSVLIVGGGPAGLEAARGLGLRGYKVMLADAERNLGGRINREITLPGLSEWVRVRDYRLQQIDKLDNVEIFPESQMQPEDIIALGANHVVIATGARWRLDGIGLYRDTPYKNLPEERVFSPDDILSGRVPSGPTLVYDDDHYYMASAIAEKLLDENIPVIFVTPEPIVSAWGEKTAEQHLVHRRLAEKGAKIITGHTLESFEGDQATLSCVYTEVTLTSDVENLVLVTSRIPNDALYQSLINRPAEASIEYPKSITRIGDCEAPAIIAGAIFAGHRYARELDTIVDPDNRMKYDRVFFEDR
ncbi:MAG: FAD-dependent oxidoreductase [Acidiferrobacterales bacterium]|nr:FAD-dependent oxidoreductase [Acidiferrobacterales bacterium]